MKLWILLSGALAVGLLADEPVLVGHWKLDDKQGETVVDSSSAKHDGKAVNAPGRTAGKIGGAFAFNGKDSYVEIPNSKQLDKVQEGSYSLAAWFKPEIAPPGTEDAANDAQFGILIKTGDHLGLSYSNEKKFTMAHYLKGDVEPDWQGIGTWEDTYEPGEWHHVVGVVDQQDRVVKIFVDGELKGTSDPWAADAKPHNYEQQTWKIGVAAPGNEQWAWYAKATICDVRIYGNALTDEQVKALYDAGVKGK